MTARSRTDWARLRRIPRRLWRLVFLRVTDVVYVLDLEKYKSQAKPLAASVAVRPLSRSDASLLVEAFGPVKAQELVTRIDACFGMLATVDGKARGYSWMTSEPRAREGEAPFFYDVSPRAGWFYFFDTFVAADARGLGLATHLKGGLIDEALSRGGRQAVATHEATNAAVIHVSEKLGFTLTGKLTYLRILGLPFKDLDGLPDGVKP